MSAGVQVFNTDNIIQIDQEYSNLSFVRKVQLSTLSQDSSDYYTLTLDDNEILVAIYTPNAEQVAENMYYNPTSDYDRQYKLLSGTASDVWLYVFGEKQNPSLNYGLQVFDENSNCIFNSNLYAMRVVYFSTDSSTSVTLSSGKKYAICTFGYNENIIENAAPSGPAWAWTIPIISNNVVTPTVCRSVSTWQPTTTWAVSKMFAYMVVDITSF